MLALSNSGETPELADLVTYTRRFGIPLIAITSRGHSTLAEAADVISQHPVALQLRTLQTMSEISIEKNSTIIFPAQFMTTVEEAIKLVKKDATK